MDDQGTIAEAVSVDALGRILKVGTEKDVTAALGTGVEIVRLAPQQVLMPGFIEPHMHLLPTLIQSLPVIHNLAPCLPLPYAAANTSNCQNDLLGALMTMKLAPSGKIKDREFSMAMNLDPSRQQFIPGACGGKGAVSFMDQPMLYIEACVGKDRPVIILDQSGHLAYVNRQAFEVTCAELAKGQDKDKGKLCDPPSSVTENGGEWVKVNGEYTGLIREAPGFQPFLQAMTKGLPLGLLQPHPVEYVEKLLEDSAKDLEQSILALRGAGLTTIADGGLSSVSQINAVKFLAERKDFPVRVTGLVRYDIASQQNLTPTGPACHPSKDPQCKLPKWLGASGIKLWVDGSTQGCTALLELPYRYQDTGHCQGAKEGRADFTSAQAIIDGLSPLWKTKSWRFQMHANGNKANQWAIDAFTQLQLQEVNPHGVLFIHNTVGSEEVSRQIGSMRKGTFVTKDGKAVPAMDARVTHLIGHVAYWGNSFEQILGADARNIDPVAFDRQNGIPFSLHSDSMVTPSRPLWFVEQAVTRRTWVYPELEKSYVLGAEHAATIEEALRAITVEPARQHELDGWLGTIEPGKVADFVVLGANPLDFNPAKGGDPTKISQIQVVQTYLNGQPTAGGSK
ncbi:amidohydrolase [Hyalangium sp.]|uniref:amidohydrolase n=1 Tax=Hyalangium sp. TaxID=2028555 RepID=UPI002D507657|nr:amidohydrolase family protein [Hyalangium sp.]HYH99096.1 amidohydrolase family protein [Hyalangium sp.]